MTNDSDKKPNPKTEHPANQSRFLPYKNRLLLKQIRLYTVDNWSYLGEFSSNMNKFMTFFVPENQLLYKRIPIIGKQVAR